MRKLAIALAILLIGISLPSCDSKKTQAECVTSAVTKFHENEKLTQEEYTATLNYAIQAYKDFLKIRDNREKTSEEATRMTAEFDARYPDYPDVIRLLEENPGDLNEANNRLRAEYDSIVRYAEETNPFKLNPVVEEELKLRR